MKLIEKFIVREVGGAPVAIATGKASAKLKGYIQLNEVSKDIFDLLQTETTEEAIVDAIVTKYEADKQVVTADVKEFIQGLSEAGLLE